MGWDNFLILHTPVFNIPIPKYSDAPTNRKILPVLKINGEIVEDAMIQMEFDRLKVHYDRQFPDQSEEERTKKIKEWSKENVIEQTLFRQAATKSNITIPAQDIADLYEQQVLKAQGEENLIKQYGAKTDLEIKRRIEIQLKSEALLKQVEDSAQVPSEDDIKAHYEKNKDTKYRLPERVRAAHIVKHCNKESDKQKAFKEMRSIKKQLEEGRPFEELASELSDCADNSGDLGYFPRGQMVQEFEDVVFDDLDIDEVSDIFWTQFGYHIAKKYDHMPEGPIPFEHAKENVKSELVREAKLKATHEFLDKLREKAEIENE